MRERKMTFRREELEQQSSAELNRLVRSELEKDSIDRETVMQILRILEGREHKDPVNQKTDNSDAWDDFRSQFAMTENSRSMSDNTHTQRKAIPWFAKTAVAAIIIFALLFAAPPALGHENIFKLIGSWTQEIFQLFDPYSDTAPQTEHEFKTDHPGLQQVYDAAENLGITPSGMPTWIPKDCQLVELKDASIPMGVRVTAKFEKEDSAIVLFLKQYERDYKYKYEKGAGIAREYEINGVVHYVMQNEGKHLAVWVIEGIEYSITTSFNEDVVLEILKSIYTEVGN